MRLRNEAAGSCPLRPCCAKFSGLFPTFFRVFFFGFALVEKNIRGKIEKQKKTISDSSNFSAIQNSRIPEKISANSKKTEGTLTWGEYMYRIRSRIEFRIFIFLAYYVKYWPHCMVPLYEWCVAKTPPTPPTTGSYRYRRYLPVATGSYPRPFRPTG